MASRGTGTQGIFWLGDPASRDPGLVGPEVACLSSCLRRRHLVPPGFCLVAPPFEALANGTLGDKAGVLGDAYARLAEMSGNADVPVVIRSVLASPSEPVSSWIRRPLAFFNISGTEAVTEAVIECIAPYVSDRARQYRWSRSKERDIRLAVVVQRFIATDAFGVVLTGGTGSGSPATMVVSAGWGVDEESAAARMDTFVVRRSDLAILERRVDDKRYMRVPGNGGTREITVPSTMRLVPCVDDDHIRLMSRLALSIEAEERKPVSVELGLSGGRLHLLWCETFDTAAPGDPQ